MIQVWNCSWCKRAFNERGEIVHVNHRPPSDGICPDCLLKMTGQTLKEFNETKQPKDESCG